MRLAVASAIFTAATCLLVASGCASGESSTAAGATNSITTMAASGSTVSASPTSTAPASPSAAPAGPGCSLAAGSAGAPGSADAAPQQPGTTVQQTYQSGGRDHTYEFYIPTSYRADAPTPLVVAFHGSGINGAAHLAFTSLRADADAHGYLVAAPNGDGPFTWFAAGASMTDPKPDTALIDALLGDVAARACVDQTRRYAQGFSAGSGLIFALLCQPERQFAAYGGVPFALPVSQCPDTPPAPLIYFHGTADSSASYQGASFGSFTIPPAPQIMSDWAAHNGCPAPPSETLVGSVQRQRWSNCTSGDDVQFYSIPGGGHTWPGGDPQIAAAIEAAFGATTTDVAATPLMWEFFSRYQSSGP